MHVRVFIDITRPLKRKMKKKTIKKKKKKNDHAERLRTFCFLCGVIDHAERFCHKLFEGIGDEMDRPFIPWLRATE